MRLNRSLFLFPLLLLCACAHEDSTLDLDNLPPDDPEAPEILTGLLYGYDALVVMPVEVDEGVSLPRSYRDRFTTAVRNRIHPRSPNSAIPPTFMDGVRFQGDAAEIHTRVTAIGERIIPKRWIFGRDRRARTVDVSVRFVDRESGDPLDDWIDLASLMDSAVGATLPDALEMAALLVSAHVSRDFAGPIQE